MKIAVFEVEHWERQAFKELGSEHEFRFSNKPLWASNANRYASTEVLSPFIYSDLSSTCSPTVQAFEANRYSFHRLRPH